ncbi:Hypothetical protein CAP_3862 [Chondromyces apiculatus DSM 436]|uniref:Uncharacterized protein n=1 Tax=Chondromyces apiculatus DSM 436 TaxID=1192034 RepID=A0A017T8A6_9BACT|nr:Hypothetical protein CAP_3862 [Chondromyces apiculatus DSM 436]
MATGHTGTPEVPEEIVAGCDPGPDAMDTPVRGHPAGMAGPHRRAGLLRSMPTPCIKPRRTDALATAIGLIDLERVKLEP